MKEEPTLEGEAASGKLDASAEKTGETSTPGTQIDQNRNSIRADRIIAGGAWLLAISMVIMAGYLAWRMRTPYAVANAEFLPTTAEEQPGAIQQVLLAPVNQESVNLPDYYQGNPVQSVSRLTSLHTIIPTRPREDVITYSVTTGDSVFGIAKNFNIQPETLLWANYAVLNDSPDMLSPGMELRVPPIDGVYYEWKEGDTLEDVANRFKSEVDKIINWSGNDLDLVNPEIPAGQMVLVPDGKREFVQWVVPVIPRGQAGVSKSVYGTGACEGSYDGAYGTGGFVWPSASRVLSGNDYWSGHLGIDIAAGIGDGIFAADSGVVVFGGWAYGGYGYMIMVDHGNGYQTLYAHLSAVSARCGQSVSQGQYIGAAGSTGNSTGSHLHFEVRYMGGFVNPWHVLP